MLAFIFLNILGLKIYTHLVYKGQMIHLLFIFLGVNIIKSFIRTFKNYNNDFFYVFALHFLV